MLEILFFMCNGALGESFPIPTLPSLKMVTAVADALSSIPVEAKLLITPPSTELPDI